MHSKIAILPVWKERDLWWGFFYTRGVNEKHQQGDLLIPVEPRALARIDTDRITNCTIIPYNKGEIDFGTISVPETRTKTINIAEHTRGCKNLQITLKKNKEQIRPNGEPRLTFSLDGADLKPGESHTVPKPGETVEMKIQISSDETMVGGRGYNYSEIIIIEPT